MSNGMETKAAVERVQFLETLLARVRGWRTEDAVDMRAAILVELDKANLKLDACIERSGTLILHGRGP